MPQGWKTGEWSRDQGRLGVGLRMKPGFGKVTLRRYCLHQGTVSAEGYWMNPILWGQGFGATDLAEPHRVPGRRCGRCRDWWGRH